MFDRPGLNTRRDIRRGFEREADGSDRKVGKDRSFASRSALKPDRDPDETAVRDHGIVAIRNNHGRR